MLPMIVLAAACAGWHPAATGAYSGEVVSRGVIPVDTWIEEAPDGRLQGRYVLHEPGRDVAGTLDAAGDTDCGTALFRWTDVYGTGLAELHFFPARHCFEGAWGREAIEPDLIWRTCIREKPTS